MSSMASFTAGYYSSAACAATPPRAALARQDLRRGHAFISGWFQTANEKVQRLGIPQDGALDLVLEPYPTIWDGISAVVFDAFMEHIKVFSSCLRQLAPIKNPKINNTITTPKEYMLQRRRKIVAQ
jgi:hypothetical protein